MGLVRRQCVAAVPIVLTAGTVLAALAAPPGGEPRTLVPTLVSSKVTVAPVFSPDGGLLAFYGPQRTQLTVWDVAERRVLTRLGGTRPDDFIYGLALSRQHELAVSAGGRLLVWDLKDWT
jgi:hypothetical protein